MKVLDDGGQGLASNLIAAIEAVQEINGGGRRIRIHGVNMSVGYDFDLSGSHVARVPFALRSIGLSNPALRWLSRPAIPDTALCKTPLRARSRRAWA